MANQISSIPQLIDAVTWELKAFLALSGTWESGNREEIGFHCAAAF